VDLTIFHTRTTNKMPTVSEDLRLMLWKVVFNQYADVPPFVDQDALIEWVIDRFLNSLLYVDGAPRKGLCTADEYLLILAHAMVGLLEPLSAEDDTLNEELQQRAHKVARHIRRLPEPLLDELDKLCRENQ